MNQNELGQISDHLGQQKWKELGMETGCWFEMDTKGGRNQIFQHPDRIPAAHRNQLQQTNVLLERETHSLGPLQPFPGQQNLGCQPSPARINVISSYMLESHP